MSNPDPRAVHSRQALSDSLFLALPKDHPAADVSRAPAEHYIRVRCAARMPSHVPVELAVQHILVSANRLIGWYLEHLDECDLDTIVAMHYEMIVNGTQSFVVFQSANRLAGPAT